MLCTASYCCSSAGLVSSFAFSTLASLSPSAELFRDPRAQLLPPPPLLHPGVSPSHQGEEQEVQLYYKMFSSTRHGFLGAGVVSQPLSHVWAAVSDPTLWPLYHKPIQTARLHQRVTNSINLGEPKEQRQRSWEAGYSGLV